eukprot:363729-Chlamydomonas_euryale.AAC.4
MGLRPAVGCRKIGPAGSQLRAARPSPSHGTCSLLVAPSWGVESATRRAAQPTGAPMGSPCRRGGGACESYVFWQP